ncbi:proprotein convertase P-domain-containing protein [Crossiella cryophila]|uniref:Streptogrisin C n=1 Tax=Crossiella cryophila TaxID=43355 RepID=A0A7W7FWF1_9PSEU|nr:proprotein convertase P-domain-containing protein [Crossiella cryophila]MBB4677859.1 streptogrisin C [Crossiella cryophila]
MRTLKVLCGLTLAAATLSTGVATPAQADTGMVEAIARDLRLTPEQARTRLTQQAEAQRIAERLPAEVRQHSAGHWFDEHTGGLTVAVTEERTAALVRAAGARPSTVRRSSAELHRLNEEVRRLAEPGIAGLTGWGVDPVANTVLVRLDATRRTAATQPFLDRVTGLGARISETAASPVPQQGQLRPGDPWFPGFEGNCSVGFAATDGKGGKHFLTAGHCTNDHDQPAYAGSGGQSRFGTANPGGRHSVFGREGDMGVVAVTEPGWTVSGTVNTWGAAPVTVSGSAEALLNQAVCHSGVASKWQCGKVTATGQTVVYPTVTIEGLSHTTACSIAGDSGGAWLAGDKAIGLHSGGLASCNPGGAPNQSSFQPVDEALRRWGLTLGGGSGGGGRVFHNDKDFAILDHQQVSSPIAVPATGAAASPVRVEVTARHTCAEDLDIDLVAPSGRSHRLHSYGGWTCHPFGGARSFTVHTGAEQAAGSWTLRIRDGGSGDTGVLDRWSITL